MKKESMKSNKSDFPITYNQHPRSSGKRKIRLTADQIRALRIEVKKARPQTRDLYDIAEKYGVSHDTVSDVKRGLRYRWVDYEPQSDYDIDEEMLREVDMSQSIDTEETN